MERAAVLVLPRSRDSALVDVRNPAPLDAGRAQRELDALNLLVAHVAIEEKMAYFFGAELPRTPPRL